MIYMFLSNNPSSGDMNLSNLSCLNSVLPVDTSDSRNSSFFLTNVVKKNIS